MIFKRPKRDTMTPAIYLVVIMVVGFVAYWFLRDRLFGGEVVTDAFQALSFASTPAPASIEIRQAPLYPERTVSPSGPNSPNQAPQEEIIHYAPPQATDPYSHPQESSEHPENLRHPERSFRPPPLNDNTSIAQSSGIASTTQQVTTSGAQGFSTEIIQGGGEFMPGIFANDTFDDRSFSSF
jgi:hypothetical protein